MLSCSGVFYNDVKARLLERLAGITPGNLNRTFLCNSGTETIEAAIKFARFATGKQEFVCAMRGFHGRTMGALSATFTKEYREPFVPVVEGFQFAPFNNFAKLAEKVNDNTAAIMLEIVQGEGGVNLGKAEFFAQVSELCRERGVLLIIDEVQTGFCRTGKMFACEHFGLEPDILCLAKAMAGGFPMGAVVCSDKIEVPGGPPRQHLRRQPAGLRRLARRHRRHDRGTAGRGRRGEGRLSDGASEGGRAAQGPGHHASSA